jgi:hypothetical protein
MRYFAIAAAALLLPISPAAAAGQTIQVNSSFNSQVFVTDGSDSQLQEQEKVMKRAMYERAARECELLRTTIALSCRITNLGVSTQINRSYGQPPTLYVSSNVSMEVVLK